MPQTTEFRCHRLAWAALALAVSLAPASMLADGQVQNAWPEDDNPTTHVQARVQSNSNGIDVEISAKQTVPGSSPAPTAPPPPSAAASPAVGPPPAETVSSDAPPETSWRDSTGYHQVTPTGDQIDLLATNIGWATAPAWQPQFDAHPMMVPFLLQVNGQPQDFVWLASTPDGQLPIIGPPAPINDVTPSGNGSSTDPRQVALDVLAHIPLPNVQVQMNPDRGLVAMAGWFWIDGYNGQPFGASRTVTIPPAAPGLPPTVFTVTVRVWVDQYEWQFGDGASVVTPSRGQPYPAQSDIRHSYEYSSLPFPSGFPVRVTVVYNAEFRVNGGGPQGLPPIIRTYEHDYPVQELQPVLTAH